jgi:hypothetical protein
VVPPEYEGFWKLVFEWQTLIAGSAAIFGGLLAYLAGVRQANATKEGAKLQTQAVTTQTAALKEQNSDLRRAEQRGLARERLVATRMLDASLQVIAESLQKARSLFGGPDEGEIDKETAALVCDTIEKPGFAYLWEKVGILDRDIAVAFLNLEAAIDRMRAQRGATRVAGMVARLDNLSNLVEPLRKLADGEINGNTLLAS